MVTLNDDSKVISRRETIQITLGSVVSVLALAQALLYRTRGTNDDIPWNILLNGLKDVAALTSNHSSKREHDWMAKETSKLLSHLHLSEPEITNFFPRRFDEFIIGSTIEPVHRSTALKIVSVELEKGARLLHHDHDAVVGVSCCMHGRVLVSSFEKVTHNSSTQTNSCLIRHVRMDPISRYQTTSLTAEKNNIHSLEAQERSELIDVFLSSEEKFGGNQYEVNEQPLSCDTRVYQARVVER